MQQADHVRASGLRITALDTRCSHTATRDQSDAAVPAPAFVQTAPSSALPALSSAPASHPSSNPQHAGRRDPARPPGKFSLQLSDLHAHEDDHTCDSVRGATSRCSPLAVHHHANVVMALAVASRSNHCGSPPTFRTSARLRTRDNASR